VEVRPVMEIAGVPGPATSQAVEAEAIR
jgi:hypothetical protein